MSPRRVPTAEMRQAELDRRMRELEFLGSPMAAYDRIVHGGAMARDLAELAQPYVHKEAQMDALNELKELLRQLTAEHEPMAQELRKWTLAPRPAGQAFDPDKAYNVALDGTDLGQYPPEHVEARRKQLRARLNSDENAAAMKIASVAAEAAKGPAARFEVGTKLSPAVLPEVALLVEQFKGRTRQEQADLIGQGSKALERGDLQTALAVKRAADVIGLRSGELDEALVAADPERQAAKAELATIQKLVGSWQADVTRRHVSAGMASDTEKVAAVSDPHDLGLSASEGPSYVDQAVGQ